MGDIHIWHRSSGSLLHHIAADQVEGDLTAISWHPVAHRRSEDPFMFAIGTYGGEVKLWSGPKAPLIIIQDPNGIFRDEDTGQSGHLGSSTQSPVDISVPGSSREAEAPGKPERRGLKAKFAVVSDEMGGTSPDSKNGGNLGDTLQLPIMIEPESGPFQEPQQNSESGRRPRKVRFNVDPNESDEVSMELGGLEGLASAPASDLEAEPSRDHEETPESNRRVRKVRFHDDEDDEVEAGDIHIEIVPA